MAFRQEQIDNWVRHDVLDGRCIRCGQAFPCDGRLFTNRGGLLFRGTPNTAFTVCQEAA